MTNWHEIGNILQYRMLQDKGSGTKINKFVYDWFFQVRSNQIPTSGPMLKSKAVEVAVRLEIKKFKNFSGWLDCFKKRYVISFKCINQKFPCGYTETANEWFDKLPSSIENSAHEDILNADENKLFYSALQNKIISLKN